MSEFFLNALVAVASPIVGLAFALAFALAFLFGLLALAGLAWAPFAAIRCARKARELGLDSWLFAQKGFAFSIIYLFPWFYLMSRLEGAQASRFWAGFAYSMLYFMWLVVGILTVITDIGGEVERVIINPMNYGDREDLGALLVFVPAPIVNIFLWVVSLISLIRRYRRDGEKPTAQSASPSINPEAAASEIIPARAYTNPFGFSLISAVITSILFIVSSIVRFSS